ncbi:hypothetical protein C2E23DRAFT_493466 [Lenzites betulinus]|nr:hypothetical protein C2E23DRAFT_493466 [Lenzites betulinus]
MSSLRTALALVVLVPALICGATPAPAPALPVGRAIGEGDSTVGNSTDVTITNFLVACTDVNCVDNCVKIATDNIPENQCQILNGGQTYNSVLMTQEGGDGPINANFEIFVGFDNCEFFTRSIPTVGLCYVIDGTPVSAFEKFSGVTFPTQF